MWAVVFFPTTESSWGFEYFVPACDSLFKDLVDNKNKINSSGWVLARINIVHSWNSGNFQLRRRGRERETRQFQEEGKIQDIFAKVKTTKGALKHLLTYL